MSFFDMFGPMFDPESGPNRSQGQRANKSGNDDPIILNVETDGDNTARSSANMLQEVRPVRVSHASRTVRANRRTATRF